MGWLISLCGSRSIIDDVKYQKMALVGSYRRALFVAYGVATDAYPVALVNFFIVLIDADYLVKLYRKADSSTR